MKILLRIFTRDVIGGLTANEEELSRFETTSTPPIPQVGQLLVLDDTEFLYRVKTVEYRYPCTDDEVYEFEIDIIVEEE